MKRFIRYLYEYENGNDSISFCLKNNEDNLRYSEVDINYIVTITDTEGNKVTDKNGEIISEKTGKIPKNEINSVDIEYTSLPEGSYIITAKAVSPYEKSISAIFNLKKEEEDFEYQVIDKINSPIVQVIVETKDYDGNIKLDWNDELFPDNTDINMEQVNLQSNIVKFNKNSSYTFTFFKSNPEKVYQKEKFSFTKVN